MTGFTFILVCPPLTPEELRQIEVLAKVKVILIYTVFSVALVLGLLGSIFTVITILLGSRSAVSPPRCSSTANPFTVYICTLAGSDFISLFLASLTVYEVNDNGYVSIQEIMTFLVFRIFQSFSHWILTLICLERFISIRYPLRKSKIYTMKTVVLSTVLAFLLSAIPFPVVFLIQEEYNLTNRAIISAANILHMSIYSILPCVFILLFSFLTGFHINRNVQRRESMMAASNSRRSVTMETQLTRMMFATALCFIVFTVPLTGLEAFYDIIMFLKTPYFCELTHERILFAYDFALHVSFLNNAVNFYVYFACAKGFRKKFQRAICCRKCLVPRLLYQ